MKKRLLSLLLALTMALSLATTGAWAAGQDSIRVTVTIANQGAIAVGKNNTLMAQVPVTVTDRNGDGEIKYDDAMIAVHKAYCEQGEAGFAINGGWVSTLWGGTEGVGGFYRNNTMTATIDKETIQNGDALTAFSYADTTNWSDKYSFFDRDTVSVKTGETLTLNLKKQGYNEAATPGNAALITVDKEGAFHELNVTTDANGNASLSFGQAGTYVVSAYGNDDILVPPVCTVTVTDTTPSKDLTKEATSAIVNCVTGYQAADKAATCQFGAEWVASVPWMAPRGGRPRMRTSRPTQPA